MISPGTEDRQPAFPYLDRLSRSATIRGGAKSERRAASGLFTPDDRQQVEKPDRLATVPSWIQEIV
jgi:hypothetical protein